MRGLITADVFKAMRLIKDADIKSEFKRVADMVNTGEKIEVRDVGFELVFNLIEKCAGKTAEADFYDLIGGILEIKPAEVGKLDPFELVEKLCELKNYIDKEKALNFFDLLSKLMK